MQRPGIRKTITQDIHLLSYLARLAERFIPEIRLYQQVQVVREFADWTLRELDFTAEGHNAERFAFIFKDNPHLYIPRIFWAYTTPRVLTMAFSHGVKIDAMEQIRQFGVDTKHVVVYPTAADNSDRAKTG